MTAPQRGVKPAISYTVPEAALATGYSVTLINDLVRAGVLRKVFPPKNLDGDTLNKPVIPYESLHAWITNAAEQPS